MSSCVISFNGFSFSSIVGRHFQLLLSLARKKGPKTITEKSTMSQREKTRKRSWENIEC